MCMCLLSFALNVKVQNYVGCRCPTFQCHNYRQSILRFFFLLSLPVTVNSDEDDDGSDSEMEVESLQVSIIARFCETR